MIKKNITLALIYSFCVVLSLTCTKPLEGSGIVVAQEQWPQTPIASTPKKTNDHLNTLEPRAAAFFPSWGKFRKIYGDVGLSLQLEAARTLKNHHWLEIWENLEWIFMDGTTGHCHTKIDIVDLSVGLKFVKRAFREKLFLYLGAGIDAGGVFIENDLRCGQSKTSHDHKFKWGFGGVAKSGGQIYFGPHAYLSLFADYLYLPIHFHHDHNVGGFKVGGGLGARF